MVASTSDPKHAELKRAALDARARAYAPYSNFRVGAALQVEDGTIFTGCNVENASYGLCLCAERVAIASAIAAGHQRFTWITIATASSPPSPPCGMCRQVMAEFSDGLGVTLVNPNGEELKTSSDALLPGSFDHRLLVAGREPNDGGGRS